MGHFLSLCIINPREVIESDRCRLLALLAYVIYRWIMSLFFKVSHFYLLALAVAFGLVSCATNSIVKPELKTELPSDFDSQNELLFGNAVLPSHMLELLDETPILVAR